jgi:hypothetical protein
MNLNKCSPVRRDEVFALLDYEDCIAAVREGDEEFHRRSLAAAIADHRADRSGGRRWTEVTNWVQISQTGVDVLN